MASERNDGYPEYETPSKQYENGPVTYFGVLPAFQGRTIAYIHWPCPTRCMFTVGWFYIEIEGVSSAGV